MNKPNYIIDNVLNNLMECCTHSYRDNTLYLELDDYNYLVDVNYNIHDGFVCNVHGKDRRFDLTDKQQDKIYIKVTHLLQDELDAIKEHGINTIN
jgi:hypothetical protein